MSALPFACRFVGALWRVGCETRTDVARISAAATSGAAIVGDDVASVDVERGSGVDRRAVAAAAARRVSRVRWPRDGRRKKQTPIERRRRSAHKPTWLGTAIKDAIVRCRVRLCVRRSLFGM